MAETTARLDHVGLAVADLRAACAWYCDVFGLVPELSLRVEAIDLSIEMLIHPAFGYRVELLHRPGTGAGAGPKPANPAEAALRDLYLPRDGGPAPVIVHVHGGGWTRGSRRHPLPVLGADFYDGLAAQGFAVAAIDYRLSGEARFPAPLDDVRAAIGWVGEHAAGYGLDPGRVFLWGDSAGGHLALLAALTGAAVHAVVAWFPVTDLTGLPSDVADAGGVPDRGPESREALLLGAPAASVPDLARQASPVAHASGAAPPVLLMHGAVDDLVPPAQSIRLAGALRAAGATVELELVPGATHMWNGASDVSGIVRRSVQFLRGLS